MLPFFEIFNNFSSNHIKKQIRLQFLSVHHLSLLFFIQLCTLNPHYYEQMPQLAVKKGLSFCGYDRARDAKFQLVKVGHSDQHNVVCKPHLQGLRVLQNGQGHHEN